MHTLIADPVTHFIAQLVAIVALSRLLGVGARRLGQPLVIAEIVAGILLGPSFLGWLWPDAAGALFSGLFGIKQPTKEQLVTGDLPRMPAE